MVLKKGFLKYGYVLVCLFCVEKAVDIFGNLGNIIKFKTDIQCTQPIRVSFVSTT